MVKRQDYLHQTCQTGGGLGVTDHRFDRADGAAAGGDSCLSIDSADGFNFRPVSFHSPCGMGFGQFHLNR